jgi:hypothetical protein
MRTPPERATYSAEPWVWLEVRGKSRGPGRLREDGGLVSELLRWMESQRIDWRPQATGGGVFVGRIPAGDAARVTAWLDEHGAKPA